MQNSFLRFWKKNDGASIVEFALLAPILFYLLFAIIEYSLILFTASIVEGGTANAARIAKTGAERSTNDNPTTRSAEDMRRIRELILQRGKWFLDDKDLTVTMTPQGTGSVQNTVGNSGEMVVYRASYRWHLMTPFMSRIIAPVDGVITLSSTTVVYNEPFE